MKKILHIKSSLMGSESYSIKLGDAIVQKIQVKYPNRKVDELDLVASEMPHLTPSVLRTFFVPKDQLNQEDKEAIRLSDELVAQVGNGSRHYSDRCTAY